MAVNCSERKKPPTNSTIISTSLRGGERKQAVGREEGGADQRVDDQHVAEAEPCRVGGRGRSSPARRPRRQGDQARLERRHAEADLQQQRQQERRRADADAEQEAADHAGAEGRDSQQRKIEDRIFARRAWRT